MYFYYHNYIDDVKIINMIMVLIIMMVLIIIYVHEDKSMGISIYIIISA